MKRLCEIENPETLAADLSASGWSAEDFRRNQMLRLADDGAGGDSASREPFDAYWTTVGRLHEVLTAAGIRPVFLKSRRNYPFYDSNVDVLIARAEWAETIRVLSADRWRVPSKLVQVKQNLIERSKLKLPPTEAGLLPAHLYGAVSWRYQSDVGFLPQGDAENRYLEQVPMAELCPGLTEFPGMKILMTTWSADLLIHSAQTAFENYRIFLGEAVFIHDLWRRLPAGEIREIEALARENGGYDALMYVREHIDTVFADPAYLRPERWPHNLSLPALWRAWYRRAGNVRKRRSTLRAAEEMFGYMLFSSLYAVKRKLF